MSSPFFTRMTCGPLRTLWAECLRLLRWLFPPYGDDRGYRRGFCSGAGILHCHDRLADQRRYRIYRADKRR